MTKLMGKAIAALRSLAEDKQHAIAGSVLSRLYDIGSGRRLASNTWASSGRADEAVDDHRAGRTTELDPESL